MTQVPGPVLLRLTTDEVCALARVSRATLWRRVAQGRLPAPIDRGRTALFCAEEVFAALSRSSHPHRTPSAGDRHLATARRRWPLGDPTT